MTLHDLFSTPNPVVLVRDEHQSRLYETISHYLDQHRKFFRVNPCQSNEDIQNILLSIQDSQATPQILHIIVNESMLTHPSWRDVEWTMRTHQELNLALLISCNASFRLPLTFVAWVQYIAMYSQETLLCPSCHYLCLDIASNTFKVILPSKDP